MVTLNLEVLICGKRGITALDGEQIFSCIYLLQ